MSKKYKSIHQLAERKKFLAARKRELESLIKKDFLAMKNDLTIHHLVEVAFSTMKLPDISNVYASSISRLIGIYVTQSSKNLLLRLEKCLAAFKVK